MKKSFLGIVVILMSGAGVFPASGNGPPDRSSGFQDLNRTDRILLTLADSLDPRARYGPGDLAAMRERPDFGIDEDAGTSGEGRGSFAYSFRFSIGSFASSGYLKIVSPPSAPGGAAEEGWIDLGTDVPTGAAVRFRKVRRSEAVSFNEVAAELTKGNLTFAVGLRRPPDEPEAGARREILAFFGRLLDNARRHGLLFRIVLRALDPEEDEPLAENGLLNSPGREDEETAISLKVAAVDDRGAVLPDVDLYAIRLDGFLARFARIEKAAWNQAKGRYEVRQPPGDGAEIRLIYPPLSNREFAQALRQDETRRRGFGIVLNVDAEFKADR
jgi:hypothetical protein